MVVSVLDTLSQCDWDNHSWQIVTYIGQPPWCKTKCSLSLNDCEGDFVRVRFQWISKQRAECCCLRRVNVCL